MRIMITGGTGFIGLNLIPKLLDNDHKITAIVRDESPTDRLPNNVDTVEVSLFSYEELENTAADFDVIIHLAATSKVQQGKGTIDRVNVQATENLLQAAANTDVENFIFTSTIHAHPASRSDSTVPDPNIYVKSKIRAEKKLLSTSDYAKNIIYPTHVVGPRDHRLRRFGLFWPVVRNRVVTQPIYRPGIINVVHVFDVVDAIGNKLFDDGFTRQVVSGQTTRRVKFLKTVASEYSNSRYVFRIPSKVTKYGTIPILKGLNEIGFLDNYDFEELAEMKNEAIPPGSLERRGVHKPRTMREIISDSLQWYAEAGLI